MRPRRSGGIVLLVPFALYGFAAGCNALTDTSATTTTTSGQPIIEIDPASFLGGVVCADLPGAMRSYVVTFNDLGPPPEVDGGPSAPGFPIALPSSEPTPCSQRVAFANGVAGHRYTAEIDGYEQDASALAAACSQKPAYAQCIGNVTTGPLGNGLCTADKDCVTGNCKGKCLDAQLEVEAADGTCKPVKDGGNVKACVYADCATVKTKCVGQPKAKAPLGAGACTEDAECFALGCFGQCKKEPLQALSSKGECATVLGAGNQAMQAGVCIYTQVSGDRHMVTVGTAEPVSPRWKTPSSDPCGGVRGILAQELQRISVSPCAPLDGDGTPSTTGVQVIPSATLGLLACDGDGDGTITKFDVEPAGLTPQTNVPCDSGDGALFEQGVVGGKAYVFAVRAYENGQAAPTRQASCFATAKEGVIVLAKCDPLVPISE